VIDPHVWKVIPVKAKEWDKRTVSDNAYKKDYNRGWNMLQRLDNTFNHGVILSFSGIILWVERTQPTSALHPL
jgi:hypothetical protein